MTTHEKLIIEANGLKAEIRITIRSIQEQWEEVENIQNTEERIKEKKKLLKKQDELMGIIENIQRMFKEYNNQ